MRLAPAKQAEPSVHSRTAEAPTEPLAPRLQAARLKKHSVMEDIDYQHPRGLDRKLFRTLATSEWTFVGGATPQLTIRPSLAQLPQATADVDVTAVVPTVRAIYFWNPPTATPGQVNEAPYGKGWLFKLKLSDRAEMDELLARDAYAKSAGV